MNFLKKIARRVLGHHESSPRGKEGARAYVIGDIHGRLDLLNILLAKIEQDVESCVGEKIYIVFLGDLIDRGPDSFGVVERLRTYRPPFATPIFLAGNHEEILLRILKGDQDVLGSWLKFGGTECADSYGVAIADIKRIGETESIRLLRSKVPAEHRKFLEGFGDSFLFGDYLCVHAGIRPGVALEAQERADLRWIREPFLSDGIDHGFVVVHGHTVVDAVEERPNRIAIDTGAYRSGMLTALVIAEARRWYLTAHSATEAPKTPDNR